MVADKPRLTTVGLDADDTLWQSEQFFKLTEARFVELLAGYAEGTDLSARLLQAEMKNLEFYGFGTKSFVLSMIETAIEVTHGRFRPQSSRKFWAPAVKC